MEFKIPEMQTAVQLVGPDDLRLNESKAVTPPGSNQILAKVEAVGLCFSDLKLLKQFTAHVRKGPVVAGIDPEVLAEIPSYVPNEAATVPGHEVVVRVAAVGEAVRSVTVGARYLVQTDYRWLRTATSNAAFGYNFEGALQEYVLMDERVITSPQGESMLLPVGQEPSAASIALVEPWACVEQAYAARERTGLKAGGRLLVLVEKEFDEKAFRRFLAGQPLPARMEIEYRQDGRTRPDGQDGQGGREQMPFDDIVYFGANAETIESLFERAANQALIQIILDGGKLARPVSLPIGRVHYGGIRIVGTTGGDPADALKVIPASAQIRPGDVVDVVGAAGPMGLMHVVRSLCQMTGAGSVQAGDLDDRRLAVLDKIARGPAELNRVDYRSYNPSSRKPDRKGTYIVIMVPSVKLVAAAIEDAAEGAIINIFAGIPATVAGPVDLQGYIEKRLYFTGTSGSTLDDMKTMLAKVQAGQIDTNVSVAAIGGLFGAIEGIRAVENQRIPGKIIIYPACRQLGLVTLEEMPGRMPEVASMLVDGIWNENAERKLLDMYS
ncbi:MAG: alcohol dehydrogenase catalytic domain-containing protein [Sedimentisphaerales bacterium]|nr:alcohol dehydrogenase catalytic domain-containing protein [Sedimentisphaerales bacterium]